MDKTLYLVRHCQTTGQEPETPLTEQGRMQAITLAERLSIGSIDRIVSSPFRRARESIAPLAQRWRLTIETDWRLTERVLCSPPIPDWQDRLAATFQDLDLCYPGGESSREAMTRGLAALADILRHPLTTTVVVTHGNLMALLLKHFDKAVGFEEWRQMTNPDVYRIHYLNEKPAVKRMTPRLGPGTIGP